MTDGRSNLLQRLARVLSGADKSLTPARVVLLTTLIILWHGLLLSFWVAVSHDIYTGNGVQLASYGYFAAVWARQNQQSVVSLDLSTALSVLPLLVFIEGVAALLFFALAAGRSKVDRRRFFSYWWRSCLWGTVVVLFVWRVARSLFWIHNRIPWEWLLIAYVVLMPAIMACVDRRPLWRMVRWRPVCPECGQAVRRTVEPRCTECGVPYPTDRPSYRRWAVRRLPWDRLSRPWFAPAAYFSTVWRILVCPCRSACGVSIPDRTGRAVRWAVVHLILAAALGTLAGSNGIYFYEVKNVILDQIDPLDPAQGHSVGAFQYAAPTPTTEMLWVTQSWTAWLVVMVTPLAIAAAVSRLAWGWSSAARKGFLKWSLYASAAMTWMLLAILVGARFARGAGGFSVFGVSSYIVTYCVPETVMLAFGILWALGANRFPTLPRRSWGTSARLFVVYTAIWYFLIWVCFPVGSLRTLL